MEFNSYDAEPDDKKVMPDALICESLFLGFLKEDLLIFL